MVPAVFHPGIPWSWRHMVSWGSSLALAGMLRVDLMEVTRIFHETHPRLPWLVVEPADPFSSERCGSQALWFHTQFSFQKCSGPDRGLAVFFILPSKDIIKKTTAICCPYHFIQERIF